MSNKQEKDKRLWINPNLYRALLIRAQLEGKKGPRQLAEHVLGNYLNNNPNEKLSLTVNLTPELKPLDLHRQVIINSDVAVAKSKLRYLTNWPTDRPVTDLRRKQIEHDLSKLSRICGRTGDAELLKLVEKAQALLARAQPANKLS